MSQSDVVSLQDAYRAFSRGDFDVASQILAPDVEWVEHGRGMPYSGIWHGRESVVKDVWTSFVQYWGGPGVVGLETDQFLDAGDQIVVTGRFVGRDSEGRTLDAPCAHVWRMSGGVATHFADYVDWSV
ncbi:nuclear transport factor 2 family protein [Blastococcus mobilis]|uniref:SnoaL-like domain-containing protein n=1 Tax=Blastococcus mobilis TaxID=1938746 RepID=A0A238VI75_9ACTN|nr:nuclear transport factor 2 family protein [Blastococcus mobilis]SNR33874.1 hypothetical protein SAMN06272737_103196 [Blastococcus mobilis]